MKSKTSLRLKVKSRFFVLGLVATEGIASSWSAGKTMIVLQGKGIMSAFLCCIFQSEIVNFRATLCDDS